MPCTSDHLQLLANSATAAAMRGFKHGSGRCFALPAHLHESFYIKLNDKIGKKIILKIKRITCVCATKKPAGIYTENSELIAMGLYIHLYSSAILIAKKEKTITIITRKTSNHLQAMGSETIINKTAP